MQVLKTPLLKQPIDDWLSLVEADDEDAAVNDDRDKETLDEDWDVVDTVSANLTKSPRPDSWLHVSERVSGKIDQTNNRSNDSFIHIELFSPKAGIELSDHFLPLSATLFDQFYVR